MHSIPGRRDRCGGDPRPAGHARRAHRHRRTELPPARRPRASPRTRWIPAGRHHRDVDGAREDHVTLPPSSSPGANPVRRRAILINRPCGARLDHDPAATRRRTHLRAPPGGSRQSARSGSPIGRRQSAVGPERDLPWSWPAIPGMARKLQADDAPDGARRDHTGEAHRDIAPRQCGPTPVSS